MNGEIDIEVKVTAPGWRQVGAAAAFAHDAAQAALRSRAARVALRRFVASAQPAELAIVLADDRTVRSLNRRYRGIDKPTNVLSFPAQDFTPGSAMPPSEAPGVLGDIVLACQTVCREAAEQGKAPGAHLSHLVVHGVLHLLGYDHEDAAAARSMEGIEARVLARLGIADPYRAAPVRRRSARRAA